MNNTLTTYKQAKQQIKDTYFSPEKFVSSRHAKIVRPINTLAKWLENNLKWYTCADWCLETYLLTGKIVIDLSKREKASQSFEECFLFIFPDLDKVKQINSVIESGEYNRDLILKKLCRDYRVKVTK